MTLQYINGLAQISTGMSENVRWMDSKARARCITFNIDLLTIQCLFLISNIITFLRVGLVCISSLVCQIIMTHYIFLTVSIVLVIKKTLEYIKKIQILNIGPIYMGFLIPYFNMFKCMRHVSKKCGM